jgi:DnaJ domain
MSKTKQAYFCYACSEEVIFRGTRVRYNVDGTLHLCKPEDKLAYEKYREYLRQDKKRLNGEDFWKWKFEVFDISRWKQSRDYYNELLEQRRKTTVEELEKERKAADAKAEEQRRRAAAERERKAEEQRKQAAREKRRAARQRRKQKEQDEAAAAAAAEERRRQQQNRRRRAPRAARREAYETRALRIMELTHDIFRLASQEAEVVISKEFQRLALKWHPDRKGGSDAKFIELNEAKEYLMGRCT